MKHTLHPAYVLLLGFGMALLGACNPGPGKTARPAPPELGSFSPASVANVSIDALPVIPVISDNAKAIYRDSLAAGRSARAFSKLGDCMTENPYFMGPFAAQAFDLKEHKDLEGVLKQYDPDSYSRKSFAAAGGFNVGGPFDPTWADPAICPDGESPIACEYRKHSPSVALIMFGTNDVGFTEPAAYDYYLRTIVSTTLDSHVLPMLSTFPTRPENAEKSKLLNQIAIKVAQDYDVPIINLNRALSVLPNNGVDPADTIHLSVPPDKRVDVLDAEHLKWGFTVRNLVTLQALDALLKAAR